MLDLRSPGRSSAVTLGRVKKGPVTERTAVVTPNPYAGWLWKLGR